MIAKNIKKIIFILLFLPLAAYGQSTSSKEDLKIAQGLTMSPVTFELAADPGDTLSNVIKITNPSSSSVGVKMEIEDFAAVGEAGKVAVLDEENKTYSLRKWIKVEPGLFTLAPGEAKIINFSINVPSNAEPGGHYASILSVVTANTAPNSGSAVAQKVGALVLLSVSGAVKEDLLIKEFSTSGFLEKGPVPFTIRFENTGSIHVRPAGFVSISDAWGKKLKDIAFPQKNILPGAIRKLDVVWDRAFLFGKYHADLVGSYGNGINSNPISAALDFWVIPWKMLGIIVLAAGAVLAILYRSRRRLFLAIRILIKGK